MKLSSFQNDDLTQVGVKIKTKKTILSKCL